jgi:hypothetical protein
MSSKTESHIEKMTLSLVSTGNDCDAFQVDRDANVIRGAQVMMAGPLPDRPLEFDETTMRQVVELGNARPDGIKARFNHPTECMPGLGTMAGVRRNFRIDGQFVRADLHFTPTRKTADMIEHVMTMGERHPNHIGNSMVVMVKREWRLNEDGTRQTDADGNQLPPLARITSLRAVDVVDEPASGTGMFGADEDDGFTNRERVVARKIVENPKIAFRAYEYLRSLFEGGDETETSEGSEPAETQEANAMEFKDLTLEALQRERPDLVTKEVDVSEFEMKGATAERDRASKILAKAEPCHFAATKEHPKGLVPHLIESGASLDDAYSQMWDASRNAAAQQAREDNSANLGIGAAPEKQQPQSDPQKALTLAVQKQLKQIGAAD